MEFIYDPVGGNIEQVIAGADNLTIGDDNGGASAPEINEGEGEILSEVIQFDSNGQIITEETYTIGADEQGQDDQEVGTILTADQIPILTAGSHIVQPDVEISPEDELKSTEKLDRSSPDLWPQDFSSAAKNILAKHAKKTGGSAEAGDPLGAWAQGLDTEDINLLHQFGSLTSASLVEEVKKLQNIAYQLDLEEAKELTRGKLLHVLDEE